MPLFTGSAPVCILLIFILAEAMSFMSEFSPRIMFVCTEDWFFFSHFLPLIRAARRIEGAQLFLVATTSGRHREIEQMGVRIIPLDFERASFRLSSAGRLAGRLLQVFWREKPDLVHFIALKPIVIGGFAASVVRLGRAKTYHLTGQGLFTVSEKAHHQKMKAIFLRLLSLYLRCKNSWLFLENPDDGKMLAQYGKLPEKRTSILGGAGVDPDLFRALPSPQNDRLKLAFVGRLVWSKGVDVLIRALGYLKADGVPLQLDLYGEPDRDNPRALPRSQLEEWNGRDDVNWHGRSDDIVEVWKKADIAVVPSRGGEGLPRSLLEAASCARPLIVTDVPGCRQFVRNGIEGLVVPPEDAPALAKAIAELAQSKERREKMGKAARKRILQGYTEDHIVDEVADIYEKLLKK